MTFIHPGTKTTDLRVGGHVKFNTHNCWYNGTVWKITDRDVTVHFWYRNGVKKVITIKLAKETA